MFKVKQWMGAAAAVAGLAFGAAQPAAAGPLSVNVVGTPGMVKVGDSFTVDVVVSGITTEIISAWDIDVAFDNTLVDNNVVTYVSVPKMGGVANTDYGADFSDGLTDAFVLSYLSDADLQTEQCTPNCAPTFTLASFGFTALVDGAPIISLVNWGRENDIKGGNAEQIFPPTEIPEPASLALVSLALAGLVTPALRRRRRPAETIA